jgi:hypothetical protein
MQAFVKESEDYEFARKTGLRLKSPPKSVKEAINTLKEAD